MTRKLFLVFSFILAFQGAQCQSKIDSLLFEYEDQIGSKKIETGVKISSYYDNDNLFKSLEYANEILAFSQEFGTKNDLLSANNRLGIVYFKLGDLSKSNDYFLAALELINKMQSSEISNEGRLMNNIANNYGELKQPELAIFYYKKSLELKKKLKDSARYSITLNNMALTYSSIHYYDSAYNVLKEALLIDYLMEDTVSAAYTNGSLGEVFLDNGIGDSAFYYLRQSLDFFNAKEHSAYVLAYYNQKLGETALLLTEYNGAQLYFKKGLEYAVQVGAKPIEKECYKGLENVSKYLGLFEAAYHYGQIYSTLQDTLFKAESAQKLSAIETSYQIKNKEQEISILNAKAQTDKYKFYVAIGGILVVLLLLAFLYYQYLFKTKANYLLEQKNGTIERQNKEITDGVKYAQGIQEAILPEFSVINRFCNMAYLYNKPAQIVSGDFYWADRINGDVVFVIADGTGHGVPGAFLSVVGTSLLKQIISENKISEPTKVLDALHQKVIETLGQSKLNSSLKDGMDVAVCTYNKEKKQLLFAGAKRPMILKRGDDIQHIKGNRASIGGNLHITPKFETHHFEVDAGDSIILYTDGVVDQFGGESNKKFLVKRLMQLVEEGEGIENLTSHFEDEIIAWKGESEQTDDMLLLAVEL